MSGDKNLFSVISIVNVYIQGQIIHRSSVEIVTFAPETLKMATRGALAGLRICSTLVQ